MCSYREKVCGEIERGSVRGERKRGRDSVCVCVCVCVQNDRNVFISRDR